MQFRHNESSAIPVAAVEALGIELTPYVSQLRRVVETGGYSAPECSLGAPSDGYMVTAVETILDRVYTKSLRHIFVIGIGGSNLGARAIYEAMALARDQVSHHHPRLVWIDTTDAPLLQSASTIIKRAEHANELLFIIISKSGTTTETIANAEILLTAFAERFGHNARRVVVMSETGSPLLAAAAEQQMHTIALPPNIGGRYSVFTPAGLLPLALVGFNPAALHAAAEESVERALHPDIKLNAAALSALTQYYYYKQGITTHDTFVFSPALESYGKWYRQLLAESIGKTTNDGRTRVGITPTVSVGSTDLHSVGQLYLGGPQTRLTTFVSVKGSAAIAVPTERAFPDVLPTISGKSTDTITAAILAGTKASYDANRLPYLSVTLDSLTPEEVARLMQTKMVEVMMLGHLLKVNPFDQPHVEQYKTVTKQILEQK